jgi:hypothetical protein
MSPQGADIPLPGNGSKELEVKGLDDMASIP